MERTTGRKGNGHRARCTASWASLVGLCIALANAEPRTRLGARPGSTASMRWSETRNGGDVVLRAIGLKAAAVGSLGATASSKSIKTRAGWKPLRHRRDDLIGVEVASPEGWAPHEQAAHSASINLFAQLGGAARILLRLSCSRLCSACGATSVSSAARFRDFSRSPANSATWVMGILRTSF